MQARTPGEEFSHCFAGDGGEEGVDCEGAVWCGGGEGGEEWEGGEAGWVVDGEGLVVGGGGEVQVGGVVLGGGWGGGDGGGVEEECEDGGEWEHRFFLAGW